MDMTAMPLQHSYQLIRLDAPQLDLIVLTAKS
jgi:hypothetical protein